MNNTEPSRIRHALRKRLAALLCLVPLMLGQPSLLPGLLAEGVTYFQRTLPAQ